MKRLLVFIVTFFLPAPALADLDKSYIKEPVCRSYAGGYLGTLKSTVNDVKIEKGVSAGVFTKAHIKLTELFLLNIDIELTNHNLTEIDKNMTSMWFGMSALVSGHFVVHNGSDFRIKGGLGAHHLLDYTRVLYHNNHFVVDKNTIGLALEFLLESRNFDMSILGSVGAGKSNDPLNGERALTARYGRIALVPRFTRLETPVVLSILHRFATDSYYDRKPIVFTATLRPTVLITPNFGLFFNFDYVVRTIDEDVEILSLGAGGLGKW